MTGVQEEYITWDILNFLDMGLYKTRVYKKKMGEKVHAHSSMIFKGSYE